MHEFLADNPAFALAPTTKQPSFRRQVRVELARRDMTIGELAREIGVERTTASLAINHDIYKPTRRKIAHFLNIAA